LSRQDHSGAHDLDTNPSYAIDTEIVGTVVLGTTRILSQGRTDALEYAADEQIDVCLPLLDGGA
jgi:hypothetical protein